MSELRSSVKCDGYHCDSKTFDFYEDGWLVIRGVLSSYEGRDKKGCAITERYLQTNGSDYHFCSWRCLMKESPKAK